jgi:hypothetical protein
VVVISTKGYSNLINSDDGKNLFWTADINTELPINMPATGPGSETPKTLPTQVIEAVKKYGDKYAL